MRRPTLIALFILAHACATLEDVTRKSFDKPIISVTGVKVNKLSFESIGLLFDLKVANPNPLALTLAGLDYDLKLNGASAVSGEQPQGIDIAAEGESTVQLPVSLNYQTLYKTFAGLRYEDQVNYAIDIGLSFKIPFLGTHRFPVSHEGPIPLPKRPSISVTAIELNRLNVAGADLNLKIKVKNPNAFGVILKSIKYDFDVDGKKWLDGKSFQDFNFAAKQEKEMRFPISLNFFQIGQSVFQLINGSSDLDYVFKGNLDMETDLPLIGKVSLPFTQSGQMPLLKK